MNITRLIAKGLCAASLCCGASVALAQALPLPPGGTQTYENTRPNGRYALPTGPWTEHSGVPIKHFEGPVTVESWKFDTSTTGGGQTPFEQLRPLRDALTNAGYEIALDCAAADCGGFDFRFGTLVLPAPQMFVTLTDYHFVSAILPGKGAVSLLASRDMTANYLQIIRIGTPPEPKNTVADPLPLPVPDLPDDLIKRLQVQGHVILSDLVFPSGSSSLSAAQIPSLDQLAEFLKQNPARQVLFVGHTDNTGSLSANKTVSQRRAQAAVDYLTKRHNVPKNQISAQGAGYLAPIASNLDSAGRTANRRIEAVIMKME